MHNAGITHNVLKWRDFHTHSFFSCLGFGHKNKLYELDLDLIYQVTECPSEFNVYVIIVASSTDS